MPKRIQMTRQRPWRHEHPDAVIVARPSKWGNPWVILTPGGGALAVQRFREIFTTDAEAAEAFRYPDADTVRAELAGRDLACGCPLEDSEGNRIPCHADVLLEIANI
jgi:hypothetical protein